MTTLESELLHAVELAIADKWDAAHDIVQRYEENSTAAWIHAVLHKIEGDAGNARYWYRIAGQLDHFNDDSTAELALIRASLTSSHFNVQR